MKSFSVKCIEHWPVIRDAANKMAADSVGIGGTNGGQPNTTVGGDRKVKGVGHSFSTPVNGFRKMKMGDIWYIVKDGFVVTTYMFEENCDADFFMLTGVYPSNKKEAGRHPPFPIDEDATPHKAGIDGETIDRKAYDEFMKGL